MLTFLLISYIELTLTYSPRGWLKASLWVKSKENERGCLKTKQPFSLYQFEIRLNNQHSIAINTELIFFFYSHIVRMHHFIVTAKCSIHHQERRIRQVEV